MSQAPQPTPEFWKLDLAKLTFAGWILILSACATVLGVAALLLGLLSILGGGANQADNHPSRLAATVAVFIGVAAGAGVFALGRLGLERLGLKVMRP
jgi:hypothetical protein